MISSKRITMTSFSVLLAAAFFASNCVLAYAPETNFWAERKKRTVQLAQLPVTLPKGVTYANRVHVGDNLVLKTKNKELRTLLESLSSQFGTIRRIINPQSPFAEATGDKSSSTKPARRSFSEGGSKLIIHVQDVHQNREAQTNMGAAIQELIDSGLIDLIALEGAFGAIDLARFRTFPRQNTIRKVADYLLQENKISGPIHTAFTSPAPIPPIVGVDDARHYHANVEAYKKSASLMEPSKRKWERTREALHQQKKDIFNHDLWAFDQTVASYRSNNLPMGDYLEHLSKGAKQIPPAIQTFLTALQLEKAIQLPRVEEERTRLLTQLLKKLGKPQADSLMSAGVAYRLGKIRHADFYRFLKTLCRQNNVPLHRFPAMATYLQYILISESLQAETLFKEIKQLEKTRYIKLAQSDEERRLIDESRMHFLTGKLLDFSLTPEEWKEYKDSSPRSGEVRRGHLIAFENFYHHAQARDHAMANNMLSAMENNNANVAVLVTGGFHSPGMNRVLEEANVTTLTFVPKITEIESANGTSYLSVFTQEKTPLDQLFEGKKLFLAKKAFPSRIEKQASVMVALESFRLGELPLKKIRRIIMDTLGWTRFTFKKVGDTAVRLIGREIIEQRYNKDSSIKEVALVPSGFFLPASLHYLWLIARGVKPDIAQEEALNKLPIEGGAISLVMLIFGSFSFASLLFLGAYVLAHVGFVIFIYFISANRPFISNSAKREALLGAIGLPTIIFLLYSSAFYQSNFWLFSILFLIAISAHWWIDRNMMQHTGKIIFSAQTEASPDLTNGEEPTSGPKLSDWEKDFVKRLFSEDKNEDEDELAELHHQLENMERAITPQRGERSWKKPLEYTKDYIGTRPELRTLVLADYFPYRDQRFSLEWLKSMSEFSKRWVVIDFEESTIALFEWMDKNSVGVRPSERIEAINRFVNHHFSPEEQANEEGRMDRLRFELGFPEGRKEENMRVTLDLRFWVQLQEAGQESETTDVQVVDKTGKEAQEWRNFDGKQIVLGAPDLTDSYFTDPNGAVATFVHVDGSEDYGFNNFDTWRAIGFKAYELTEDDGLEGRERLGTVGVVMTDEVKKIATEYGKEEDASVPLVYVTRVNPDRQEVTDEDRRVVEGLFDLFGKDESGSPPPASLHYLFEVARGVPHDIAAKRAIKFLWVEGIGIAFVLWLLGPFSMGSNLFWGGFSLAHVVLMIIIIAKRGPPESSEKINIHRLAWFFITPAVVFLFYSLAFLLPFYLLKILMVLVVFLLHRWIDTAMMNHIGATVVLDSLVTPPQNLFGDPNESESFEWDYHAYVWEIILWEKSARKRSAGSSSRAEEEVRIEGLSQPFRYSGQGHHNISRFEEISPSDFDAGRREFEKWAGSTRNLIQLEALLPWMIRHLFKQELDINLAVQMVTAASSLLASPRLHSLISDQVKFGPNERVYLLLHIFAEERMRQNGGDSPELLAYYGQFAARLKIELVRSARPSEITLIRDALLSFATTERDQKIRDSIGDFVTDLTERDWSEETIFSALAQHADQSFGKALVETVVERNLRNSANVGDNIGEMVGQVKREIQSQAGALSWQEPLEYTKAHVLMHRELKALVLSSFYGRLDPEISSDMLSEGLKFQLRWLETMSEFSDRWVVIAGTEYTVGIFNWLDAIGNDKSRKERIEALNRFVSSRFSSEELNDEEGMMNKLRSELGFSLRDDDMGAPSVTLTLRFWVGLQKARQRSRSTVFILDPDEGGEDQDWRSWNGRRLILDSRLTFSDEDFMERDDVMTFVHVDGQPKYGVGPLSFLNQVFSSGRFSFWEGISVAVHELMAGKDGEWRKLPATVGFHMNDQLKRIAQRALEADARVDFVYTSKPEADAEDDDGNDGGDGGDDDDSSPNDPRQRSGRSLVGAAPASLYYLWQIARGVSPDDARERALPTVWIEASAVLLPMIFLGSFWTIHGVPGVDILLARIGVVGLVFVLAHVAMMIYVLFGSKHSPPFTWLQKAGSLAGSFMVPAFVFFLYFLSLMNSYPWLIIFLVSIMLGVHHGLDVTMMDYFARTFEEARRLEEDRLRDPFLEGDEADFSLAYEGYFYQIFREIQRTVRSGQKGAEVWIQGLGRSFRYSGEAREILSRFEAVPPSDFNTGREKFKQALAAPKTNLIALEPMLPWMIHHLFRPSLDIEIETQVDIAVRSLLASPRLQSVSADGIAFGFIERTYLLLHLFSAEQERRTDAEPAPWAAHYERFVAHLKRELVWSALPYERKRIRDALIDFVATEEVDKPIRDSMGAFIAELKTAGQPEPSHFARMVTRAEIRFEKRLQQYSTDLGAGKSQDDTNEKIAEVKSAIEPEVGTPLWRDPLNQTEVHVKKDRETQALVLTSFLGRFSPWAREEMATRSLRFQLEWLRTMSYFSTKWIISGSDYTNSLFTWLGLSGSEESPSDLIDRLEIFVNETVREEDLEDEEKMMNELRTALKFPRREVRWREREVTRTLQFWVDLRRTRQKSGAQILISNPYEEGGEHWTQLEGRKLVLDAALTFAREDYAKRGDVMTFVHLDAKQEYGKNPAHELEMIALEEGEFLFWSGVSVATHGLVEENEAEWKRESTTVGFEMNDELKRIAAQDIANDALADIVYVTKLGSDPGRGDHDDDRNDDDGDDENKNDGSGTGYKGDSSSHSTQSQGKKSAAAPVLTPASLYYLWQIARGIPHDVAREKALRSLSAEGALVTLVLLLFEPYSIISLRFGIVFVLAHVALVVFISFRSEYRSYFTGAQKGIIFIGSFGFPYLIFYLYSLAVAVPIFWLMVPLVLIVYQMHRWLDKNFMALFGRLIDSAVRAKSTTGERQRPDKLDSSRHVDKARRAIEPEVGAPSWEEPFSDAKKHAEDTQLKTLVLSSFGMRILPGTEHDTLPDGVAFQLRWFEEMSAFSKIWVVNDDGEYTRYINGLMDISGVNMESNQRVETLQDFVNSDFEDVDLDDEEKMIDELWDRLKLPREEMEQMSVVTLTLRFWVRLQRARQKMSAQVFIMDKFGVVKRPWRDWDGRKIVLDTTMLYGDEDFVERKDVMTFLHMDGEPPREIKLAQFEDFDSFILNLRVFRKIIAMAAHQLATDSGRWDQPRATVGFLMNDQLKNLAFEYTNVDMLADFVYVTKPNQDNKLIRPPASLHYLWQIARGVPHDVAAERAIKFLPLEGIGIALVLVLAGPFSMVSMFFWFLFAAAHAVLMVVIILRKRGPPDSSEEINVRRLARFFITPAVVFLFYSLAFLPPSYWIAIPLALPVYYFHRRFDSRVLLRDVHKKEVVLPLGLSDSHPDSTEDHLESTEGEVRIEGLRKPLLYSSPSHRSDPLVNVNILDFERAFPSSFEEGKQRLAHLLASPGRDSEKGHLRLRLFPWLIRHLFRPDLDIDVEKQKEIATELLSSSELQSITANTIGLYERIYLLLHVFVAEKTAGDHRSKEEDRPGTWLALHKEFMKNLKIELMRRVEPSDQETVQNIFLDFAVAEPIVRGALGSFNDLIRQVDWNQDSSFSAPVVDSESNALYTDLGHALSATELPPDDEDLENKLDWVKSAITPPSKKAESWTTPLTYAANYVRNSPDKLKTLVLASFSHFFHTVDETGTLTNGLNFQLEWLKRMTSFSRTWVVASSEHTEDLFVWMDMNNVAMTTSDRIQKLSDFVNSGFPQGGSHDEESLMDDLWSKLQLPKAQIEESPSATMTLRFWVKLKKAAREAGAVVVVVDSSNEEEREAWKNLDGKKIVLDRPSIPSSYFTDPDSGMMTFVHVEAREKYPTGTFNTWEAIATGAHTLVAEEGFEWGDPNNAVGVEMTKEMQAIASHYGKKGDDGVPIVFVTGPDSGRWDGGDDDDGDEGLPPDPAPSSAEAGLGKLMDALRLVGAGPSSTSSLYSLWQMTRRVLVAFLPRWINGSVEKNESHEEPEQIDARTIENLIGERTPLYELGKMNSRLVAEDKTRSLNRRDRKKKELILPPIHRIKLNPALRRATNVSA